MTNPSFREEWERERTRFTLPLPQVENQLQAAYNATLMGTSVTGKLVMTTPQGAYDPIVRINDSRTERELIILVGEVLTLNGHLSIRIEWHKRHGMAIAFPER